MKTGSHKTRRLGWLLAFSIIIGIGAAGLLQAQQDQQPSAPPTEKSQEEVLEGLLKDPLPKPLTIPAEGSDKVTIPAVKSVDPKAKKPLLVREGDPVINRMGRLHKDPKGTPFFVYEADGTALTEPPLILLPCQNLELMERWTKGKPDAKFLITGEIMVYHGKGYLLPRKVMLHRAMGQF